MKVVCVDDSPDMHPAAIKPNGHVIKGEKYSVVDIKTAFGQVGYILAEKPIVSGWFGGPVAWHSSRFVPADYYEAEFAVKETETQPTEQTV